MSHSFRCWLCHGVQIYHSHMDMHDFTTGYAIWNMLWMDSLMWSCRTYRSHQREEVAIPYNRARRETWKASGHAIPNPMICIIMRSLDHSIPARYIYWSRRMVIAVFITENIVLWIIGIITWIQNVTLSYHVTTAFPHQTMDGIVVVPGTCVTVLCWYIYFQLLRSL